MFAALAVFSATAVPAGAQTEDTPVETEETETTEVIVDTNGKRATVTTSETTSVVKVTQGTGNPIQHNNNGPVYACYFAENYAGHPTNFVADTAAPNLQVGTTYWRVCYDGGGAIADDDIALWTDTGWELGGTTEFELLQLLDNNVLNAYPIDLKLSPTDDQITGVETWIYSESRTNIAAVYATAGGVNAAVRARLENVKITPGDSGEPFDCTSFGKWAPASVADCSHTYFVQPESGTYTMETTTTWLVEEFTPATGWNERAERIVIELAYDIVVIDLEAVIGR